MGMRPRLDAVADEIGERFMLILHAALKNDGIVDRQEAPGVVKAAIDWKRASRRARVGGSLAECSVHGVDVGPYFEGNVGAYRDAMDAPQ